MSMMALITIGLTGSAGNKSHRPLSPVQGQLLVPSTLTVSREQLVWWHRPMAVTDCVSPKHVLGKD